MSALRELAMLELPDPEMTDDDARLYFRMTEHAYQALRASQPPTYQDYIGMDWLERAAFAEAADRMRLETSDRILATIGEHLVDTAESVFLAQRTAQAVADVQREMSSG